MEIIVGSQNIPKKLAVVSAFKKLHPDTFLDVQGVAADSGVSSHPVNVEESLEGAMNRAKHAREFHPSADYYVGIEGGLLSVGELAWEIGWVAIENSKGEIFTAPSAGLEVKGKILEAIRGGQELNDILRDDFGVKNAGQKNGYYGLITDDLVTREQGYEQAIIFAFAPFRHGEYFK